MDRFPGLIESFMVAMMPSFRAVMEKVGFGSQADELRGTSSVKYPGRNIGRHSSGILDDDSSQNDSLNSATTESCACEPDNTLTEIAVTGSEYGKK